MTLATTLTITPEIVQEFIPCDEARNLIKSLWDNIREPGIYGNYNYYIGSFWYVEVPEYIDYLVRIDKEELAERMVVVLLSETLDQDDKMLNHIQQMMICHRLGRNYPVYLSDIEKILDERGY